MNSSRRGSWPTIATTRTSPSGRCATHELALRSGNRQIQVAPWLNQVVELADTDSNQWRDVRRLAVDESFPELHWDPRRRGGLPVVGDSNVLAQTVAGFIEAGESVDDVADWYHLTPEQVDEAVRFDRIHASAA